MLDGFLFSLFIAASAQLSLTAPAGDVELWRAAESGLDVPEKAYAKELSARLQSTNPYDRLLALKRLRALPALVSPELTRRLADLASEDVKLFDSKECLEEHSAGVAVDCPMTTIGNYARLVLLQLPSDRVATVMVERVLQDPNAAEALAPLVANVYGDRASALVPELKRAKTVEQQSAMLLLATELDCAASDVDVASLKPFLMSTSEPVRVRAALVVLKRSDGCDHTAAPVGGGAREQATRIVADAVDRDQPPSILADLHRIGTAASPAIPSLLKRLDKDVRVLVVLGGIKFRARTTAPRLAAMLEDPAHKAVHRDVLKALSLIRPGPEQVRQAILASVQRQSSLLPEGARALADIEAPVNAGELEYLSRLYRTQCKADNAQYSFRKQSDCHTTNSALTSLAARSGLRFEARVP